MKKVLLAIDGSNFSKGAFEFARKMNETEPILLTGLFVPQVEYASAMSYAAPAGAIDGIPSFPYAAEEDFEEIEKNVGRFKHMCEHNGITYRVHQGDIASVMAELKKESRFADLVVIGSESFYNGEDESFRYLNFRDALHTLECPAIIVPEKFTFPDNNILAYDGSEESVFAIKEFAYLLPQLAKNSTVLVYADESPDTDLPSRDLAVELATRHYSDLTLRKLQIDPQKYFQTWMSKKESSILVCGSFSRSALSQVFKKSFAMDIIADHKIPVFIAHK